MESAEEAVDDPSGDNFDVAERLFGPKPGPLDLASLRADQARLQAATVELARETRVRLFRTFAQTELPGYQKAEFVAGDATLDLANDEIAALFQSLLQRAEA